MQEAVLIIIGLVIGAVAGIAYGMMRGRRQGEPQAQGLGERVSALTATLEEVRGQAEASAAELTQVREALEQKKIDNAEDKARLEMERKHFAEQRRQIEEMEKKVKETFGALSAAALKSNNEQFVTLAEEKMKPLREQLQRYEQQIKELEKARSDAYGGLNRQLVQLAEGREQLSRQTQQLVAALRQPGAKGKWGEVTLKRIVELSGMSPYCDFDEQVSVDSESGRQRPDMVVHLPGGRSLVIDSKVNTAAYLDAVRATDEAEKKAHLQKFALDVRNTSKALGGKAYWRQFDRAPEFVVMFMPGEAFFAAAVAQDSDLITEGMEQRVLLSSPTTLAALLMAIRYGWQQQQVAENAERIAVAGRELYDRLCTFVGHLDDVRAGIEKAAQAYDKAVGNWERRTLPGVRRLKELGAETGREMADLRRVDATMRPMLPVDEDDAESDARQAS